CRDGLRVVARYAFHLGLLCSDLVHIQLRIDAIKCARKWNGLPHVLEAADPGNGTLDPHAEASVRDSTIFAQIEIPLESRLRQAVFMNALQQQLIGANAL